MESSHEGSMLDETSYLRKKRHHLTECINEKKTREIWDLMASMSMVFKHVYRNANQVESIGKAGGEHRHNCHLLKFSNQPGE